MAMTDANSILAGHLEELTEPVDFGVEQHFRCLLAKFLGALNLPLDGMNQLILFRGLQGIGGGGIVPSSRITTRFGPSAPRCSQIDAEPGPPLNTKHTGRVFGSAPSRK